MSGGFSYGPDGVAGIAGLLMVQAMASDAPRWTAPATAAHSDRSSAEPRRSPANSKTD
jgi:hypothetical protein